MTYLFLKVLVVVLMAAAVAVAQNTASVASSLYSEGVTLLESGKPDEAAKRFEKTAALDPQNSAFHYALGLARYKAHRYSEALEAFTRFAELKPGAVAFNQVGITLIELGRYREALDSYNKALKYAPDDAVVLQNAGMTSVTLGQYKDAVELLERSRSLGRNNPELRANLGYAYAARKSYKKALAEFQELSRVMPDDLGVKYALASLYMATGDRDAATSQQKQVASLDPMLGRKLQRAMFSDKVVAVEDLGLKPH
jgi:tetratricopeptide (TPR) repeat protein